MKHIWLGKNDDSNDAIIDVGREKLNLSDIGDRRSIWLTFKMLSLNIVYLSNFKAFVSQTVFFAVKFICANELSSSLSFSSFSILYVNIISSSISCFNLYLVFCIYCFHCLFAWIMIMSSERVQNIFYSKTKSLSIVL